MSKQGTEIVRLLRKEPDSWTIIKWDDPDRPNSLFRHGKDRSLMICGLRVPLPHLSVWRGDPGSGRSMLPVKTTFWDKWRIADAASQVCWHMTRRGAK